MRMTTQRTICDFCGLEVEGDGADPNIHYNPYQWQVLSLSGKQSLGDDGTKSYEHKFDVCHKCIDPVHRALVAAKKPGAPK